jgi:polyhydroxybutyrate depolymerase
MFSTRHMLAVALALVGCATRGPANGPAIDGGAPVDRAAPPPEMDGAGSGPAGVDAPPAQPPPVSNPPPPSPSPDAGAGMPGAARPSPGCSGGSAITAGAAARTLVVEGANRTYTLVVPAGARAGVPLPLVFAWHGLGGSGRQARMYFGLEAAAGSAALLVYPDALPLPSFGNRAGWDLRPEGPDLRFFDAMLDEVSRGSCVDLARVFSTGHSFGGYMTNTLGCQRGKVLRAIAPVAGGLGGGGCMATPLPAWIAHASNDGVVPFAQGEAARAQWARASGCATTSQPGSLAGSRPASRAARRGRSSTVRLRGGW